MAHHHWLHRAETNSNAPTCGCYPNHSPNRNPYYSSNLNPNCHPLTGLDLSDSSTTPQAISYLTLSRCQQGVVNHGRPLTLTNSILTVCDIAVSTKLSGTTAISYTLLNSNGQDFVTETGAQLVQGSGILTQAPSFVDFPNNFHLQPNSPAVNAADPQADYSREPGYNGARADLGAYGNTRGAPQQPPLDQMAVTLETATPVQTGQAGQVISYTINLQNSGAVTDNYRVSVKSDEDFQTSLYKNGGYGEPLQLPDLAPQAQTEVTVWATIPSVPPLDLTRAISVTAVGEYGIQTTVVLTTQVSIFQEVGGQVVMEGEHFTRQVDQSDRAWLTQTVQSNYMGSSYISALPDTDRQFTTTYTTTSPELNFTFNVTTTGMYTLWLRGYAPNGAGDSVYVGLDEQSATSLTGFVPSEWSWANSNMEGGVVTLEVTQPGLHLLRLWQREDGLRLDRILLTTDSNYNPVGGGPPESEIR